MRRKFPEPEIENNLAGVRNRRGWSAADLAGAVGISRQAIYAVEAGTYVPNTALTLRLAQALEVSVDELFRLKKGGEAPSKSVAKADLIPAETETRSGQAVQLARVGERLVAAVPPPPQWYLPVSDGVVGSAAADGKVSVAPYQSEDLTDRLVIAGCDPAMSILARHLYLAGFQTVLVHQNSSRALRLLKGRSIHIAGTHFRDAANDEANLAAVKKIFGAEGAAIISFATWQEGLITAPGNPKGIKRIEDLARKHIRFVNRETGAATRLFLDKTLAGLHMKPRQIDGYANEAQSHLAAAREVSKGKADCCIATEAAARTLGLCFVPLQTARYDLVTRREHLLLPAMRVLLDTISRLNFRRELSGAAGYETAATGTRVL